MYRVGNRARKGHGARLQNLEGCGQSNGAKTTVLYIPPNLELWRLSLVLTEKP